MQADGLMLRRCAGRWSWGSSVSRHLAMSIAAVPQKELRREGSGERIQSQAAKPPSAWQLLRRGLARDGARIVAPRPMMCAEASRSGPSEHRRPTTAMPDWAMQRMG